MSKPLTVTQLRAVLDQAQPDDPILLMMNDEYAWHALDAWVGEGEVCIDDRPPSIR